MVKFLTTFIAIFSLATITCTQSSTPVIGGTCKLGTPDVQIGGKQTQFFLKCESNSDSGEGQGVWVVKSRSASSGTKAPPTVLEETSSSKIDPPKTMSKLAQPTICEQDSNSKPGGKCSAPVTCLQTYYPERNSFLQCDESTKVWIKKYCKNLMATFSFEHQACIGADRPGVSLTIYCTSNEKCKNKYDCKVNEFCSKLTKCCHKKKRDQKYNNDLIKNISTNNGQRLIFSASTFKNPSIDLLKFKDDLTNNITNNYDNNNKFERTTTLINNYKPNNITNILTTQLPIHVCPSKKRCSYPLNTCDHGEYCEKNTMCCHLYKCPDTNKPPFIEPDYCTSIYQCPSNSYCISGKCCRKPEISIEMSKKIKDTQNIDLQNKLKNTFKNYKCEIDPLAEEVCSIDKPCPDDSICVNGVCCLRPITSLCDNGLYSLTIPLSCIINNDCGTTAKCERNRCCPLELKEIEKEDKIKIKQIKSISENSFELENITSNSFNNFLNTTSIENFSKSLPITELTPLLTNLPIYPVSPKILSPNKSYIERMCYNGHEALSTPSNCLVNEDCPNGYNCNINLCCPIDENQTISQEFDKEYKEEKLKMINGEKKIYDLKNFTNLTEEKIKDEEKQSTELLMAFNNSTKNLIQILESSTEDEESDKINSYFIMIFLILLTIILLFFLILRYIFDIDNYTKFQKSLHNIIYKKDQYFLSNIFNVNEKSTRHGGELVGEVLKAHGVQEIFTLCGGHISPILVGCEKQKIRVIDTRHEVTAVFAADAVARLRQSFGVVTVTAGPGLTNTITAIKNGQMAESPILLLGGAAPSLLKGRGALQDIDQIVLFKPLCKYVARITRLQDIIPILKKAIQIARSDTPGPVFVEFPVDMLYPYQLVLKEAGIIPNPKSLIKKIINTYIFYNISKQFGNAWNEINTHPLPVHIPLVNNSDIDKFINILKISKKPILLIGSQATLPPIKAGELKEIVEDLGIPCYLGGMARGLLGKDNKLQMRQCRKDALKEADLIILAGTVPDFRLSYGRAFSSKAKIISINRNEEQLKKNEKVFWNGDLLIKADVGSSLKKLLYSKRHTTTPNINDWIDTLRKRDNDKEEENKKKIEEKNINGGLNPLKVLSHLDSILSDDTILIADGGDFVGSAAYIVRPRGPLQWLDPGAFGTLGVGGGFAIGAKVVYPNKPVLIIYGDGSSGYSIMEYDTYVRHNLPVISLIGNDACWSQIAREQEPMFNSSVAVNLSHTKYHEIAKAIGAEGYELTEKDSDDKIKQTIEKALIEGKKDKSSLINVIIGKSNFREGSISV
ncbi:Cysteine-rich repeat and Thiamine pyrophosphate enzyme, C-terminal TPP-binding domain and Thiamine pyrophosphate enzyme, central domain and Thiamine pyrophosphate enzyme, N-terminal TPP-binding domain-containing protein [Strongyloides ratti]|uniref:2-hydroxyacyl-CoA lyase 2 n=1 Tax=Strongyloides ratti TaxID=34506 RepID=A0A090LB59_STRRB|nr:Cysteine-rich repeat and Thiamine pyrophosphate enzyme, C-terminal TPP-binding domain and Thiamine pyrophosphate enzyme, central domain and Thiamine pyrophosphate enzyme, N-terminal TPP-binding domain-containing protein [Strongyloides ratti]CEF65358.1 Cysteine-rich repeat and Thiamine pyrophosphate enzyme, C-terminal TPP-binding domain and Thiamine pyrophosphate enzyme, central domain and Thiamine pyrophosphate enzyme, N-terminal TPP-binding domain-containing protein [Strongyloides ratti]